MFINEQNYMKEPDFSAFLYVVRQAILEVRFLIRHGSPMPEDQLHDLMDAIENIPVMLREGGGWHVKENILPYLKHYDEKWANETFDGHRAMSLMTVYKEGLEKYKKQQEGKNE